MKDVKPVEIAGTKKSEYMLMYLKQRLRTKISETCIEE
jgi:hypothetical protein